MSLRKPLPTLYSLVATLFLSAGPLAAETHPGTPAEARAVEAKEAMPPTRFFDARLTPGPDGSLVRSERTEGFEIPAGAIATRILYRSRNAAGKPVLSSATVVTPPGEKPVGGWPVLVWAHGTTGVAQRCGPSVSREVGYYVQTLLAQGFAVVAVDYAGLATPGGHQYLNAKANAYDTINSVPAAHAAVTGLSRHWVTIGHSQGGLAVWGVAALEAKRNDPTYLGGVSLAPGVGGADLLQAAADHQGDTFYPVFWAYGIKQQFPDFQVRNLLSDVALPYYRELTTQGCWEFAHATFLPMKSHTVLREGWRNDPIVRKFMAANEVGHTPIKGPLFVGAGAADLTVPTSILETVVANQRRASGDVSFKVYPGDHGEMLETSFKDQMAWIRGRFASVR